tara:strand:- start:1166 stop:2491 length:1326 start_codon:yes stop_codon:yes gene_type:complete
MVYFLGRDVKLAISTEQESFGIKKVGNILDITGTDVSAKVDSTSLLNGVINSSVTSVVIDDEADFSVNDVILVDSEKMLVTAVTSDSTHTLTVVRGYLGSTAAAQDDDAIVYKVSHGVNADDIPPRPYALKASGATALKEVSTITIEGTTVGSNLESASASSNKYILLYDPDGDVYMIYFESGGSGATAPSTGALTGVTITATLKVSVGDADNTSACASALNTAINNDDSFSKLFITSVSGATVTVNSVQSGAISDVFAGAGLTTTPNVSVGVSTSGVARSNDLADITGLEISVGVTDEDIVYMGQRTALKAEIKKDTSVTITRKKSDNLFNLLFNQARAGIRHTDGTIDADINETDSKLVLHDNLVMPTAISSGSNFGYRVYIQIKSGSEVMTLINACISEYSTTLSPDGVSEETITFMTYVSPKIQSTAYTTVASQTDF